MKLGKQIKQDNGFRALHTDFINNEEKNGYRVTYVSGTDDPHNSPEEAAKKIKFQQKKQLTVKLVNDTLTFKEFKEMTRLEKGL